MQVERTTKEEMKRIMDSMIYHCMDLTNFMAKNREDPYFNTEEGKRMMKHAMSICAEHAMACMEFMMNKTDKDGDLDIEKMLKDML